MASLTNYAQVQAALNTFVQQAGVTPGQAPHGAFWNSLTYEQFITGNVPNVNVPHSWKILEVGHPESSNIIQILSGMGDAYNDYGQMPQPNPPYDPEQTTLIGQLSEWIKNGCQNNT
jgi:hypothetical protein